MHTKLTIPERLKDLRVSEKRMSLQELSDATGIPSSTLGNYEKDENMDMSLGNLITLESSFCSSVRGNPLKMPLSPQRILPSWFSAKCASCGTITMS